MIPIGFLIGIVCVVFGRVLLFIGNFRTEYFNYLIPFLAVFGLLSVFVYEKFGRESKRGMTQIIDVYIKREQQIPLILVPLIMLTTWGAHLFGVSCGREGVAIQIGATLAHNAGRKFCPCESGIFVAAGVAAGFAGLFKTPIAAIFFAIEILRAKKINLRAVLPAVASSFSAYFASGACGLSKLEFALGVEIAFSLVFVLKLILFGVVFGLAGLLFSSLLKFSKSFFADKLKTHIFVF